jgi:hypothetical protein
MISVLTMLQEECDRQTERILTEFRKKRSVRDKTARVREVLYGGGGVGVGVVGPGQQQDRAVAAKDLDHVLSEMTLLAARSEMYYKFVRKRVTVRDVRQKAKIARSRCIFFADRRRSLYRGRDREKGEDYRDFEPASSERPLPLDAGPLG